MKSRNELLAEIHNMQVMQATEAEKKKKFEEEHFKKVAECEEKYLKFLEENINTANSYRKVALEAKGAAAKASLTIIANKMYDLGYNTFFSNLYWSTGNLEDKDITILKVTW